MNGNTTSVEAASPFHAGEQELQQRAGKRESLEAFGRRVVRPYLPDQHRRFYQQLPFVVLGAVDPDGWPWSSLIPGRPGFISSPDDRTLRIDAVARPGDSAADSVRAGAPLGLLGIDLATRRRNRMNGRVMDQDADGFSIHVDQSFGNCPQYIQKRSLEFVREPNSEQEHQKSERFTTLSNEARALISNADTFFVSSYVTARERPDIEGVDVSHRGGRSGFVAVDGNTLTIPDFRGNFYFNTLGNFLLNPKAGLVFADFSTGDLLQLSGTVELLDKGDPALLGFRGAERGWRFLLNRGNWVRDALPFRFSSPERSPNNELTDDWQTARARAERLLAIDPAAPPTR